MYVRVYVCLVRENCYIAHACEMQIKVKKYIVAGYWMCVGKSYTDTIYVMQIQINKIKLQIISQVLITLEKESNWTES